MISLQQHQIDVVAWLTATEQRADNIAAARLAIHRNNMNASLLAVLEARFPVVRRLVGEEFFAALALTFLHRHPPQSPVLARYGHEFGNFLRGFEPVQTLPYLPDMAALEWARHQAYHAADAGSAAITDLAALPETALASTRLVLHPAASLVASDYPIVSLWRTNTHDEVVQPLTADKGGEVALITRPRLDVLVTPLSADGAAFFAALQQGLDLASAVDATEAKEDVPRLLAALFDAGAIAAIA